MSKNNNEEILLPKTKAVPKEDFYLKNLSADQIVKLVSGFKPGVAQSGNVLASAFGPLADEFIEIAIDKKSNLVDQLKYINTLWDDFCLVEIDFHFEKLLSEEGNKIRDEILHYPLFARRRILEIVRIKAPKIFLQVICIQPFSFYTVSQLWDPNKEVNNAVRDYYDNLVKTYLDFYESNISASSYLDFINIVKSPYRELYNISNYFEADYTYDKFRAIFLKQLAAARTGVALDLRPEQIEGQAQKSFIMPPPVTIAAIGSLTLRWLSEQSLNFKNDLPAVLLEFVLEHSKDFYQKLVADLGKVLTSGILRGIEVGFDSEFPEFDQASVCFKEIAKYHTNKVNMEMFNSPIHRNLLATTSQLVAQELEDKKRDAKRLELSISYLRGRRIYRPWEIKSLNQEIRKLQRDFYQRDLEIDSKQKQVQQLLQITKEVLEVYQDDDNSEIIKIADNVCEKVDLSKLLKDESLNDPLLLTDVFSFETKKEKISLLINELNELGYIETKIKNIEDRELVDYLHIWGEINAGKKIKELRKEYKDFRVNRVLVEYEHRVNKKSFDEIKKLEPKLTNVVSLVRNRDNFDRVLIELANIIISKSKEITNKFVAGNKPKDCLEEFQYYASAVSIVWDWVTLQDVNPYLIGTNKAQKYQPWFEKELAQVIKDRDLNCYDALSYLRPASVLGIEPGADFNWRDLPIFQQHITVLVNKFLNLISKFPEDQILTIFSRFKGGIASPFSGYLNTKRYDLDSSTDKILLLSDSQKHLFTSCYRRDALTLWVSFHEEAFFGIHPLDGILFELFMKELKSKHKEVHLLMCLELVKLERDDVINSSQKTFGHIEDDQLTDELISLIQYGTEKVSFLEGLRRSLS